MLSKHICKKISQKIPKNAIQTLPPLDELDTFIIIFRNKQIGKGRKTCKATREKGRVWKLNNKRNDYLINVLSDKTFH